MIYLETIQNAAIGNSQSTDLTKVKAQKWSFYISCLEKRKTGDICLDSN